MKNIKNNIVGLTLVEIIVSIAIIGIIVVTFLPLFVMSAKSNSKAEAGLDSTYVGRDVMEIVYGLSKKPYEEWEEELEKELKKEGYSKDILKDTFKSDTDETYLNIKFSEEGNLIRVIVKVSKDKSMNTLEAQYESLYHAKGRGV